jgi:hypothetical protein
MNSLAVMLGQLSLAQAADGPYSPPPLPAPPRLAHWLFEVPWPPAIGLVAMAVLLFFILNSRAQAKQGGMIALGLLLVAAATIATSFLVKTEREHLADRTRELIRATAAADVRSLGDLLASDVGLSVLTKPFSGDKDEIRDLVNRYMGNEYPLKDHSTSELSAHVDRLGGGKTLVRVRVVTDALGVNDLSNRSWWRITWRKNAAGQWEAMHIEGLQIDFVSEGMIPW